MLWTKRARQCRIFQTLSTLMKVHAIPRTIFLKKTKSQSLIKFCITIQYHERWLLELSFMTLKNHAKFEENLTCGFKNNIRNLANFYRNTWKCQNWYFHWILLSKWENTRAKKLQRSYGYDTEEWWKICCGIDLSFQNWHKEFDESWLDHWKVSKIYTLMGCF